MEKKYWSRIYQESRWDETFPLGPFDTKEEAEDAVKKYADSFLKDGVFVFGNNEKDLEVFDWVTLVIGEEERAAISLNSDEVLETISEKLYQDYDELSQDFEFSQQDKLWFDIQWGQLLKQLEDRLNFTYVQECKWIRYGV